MTYQKLFQMMLVSGQSCADLSIMVIGHLTVHIGKQSVYE